MARRAKSRVKTKRGKPPVNPSGFDSEACRRMVERARVEQDADAAFVLLARMPPDDGSPLEGRSFAEAKTQCGLSTRHGIIETERDWWAMTVIAHTLRRMSEALERMAAERGYASEEVGGEAHAWIENDNERSNN